MRNLRWAGLLTWARRSLSAVTGGILVTPTQVRAVSTRLACHASQRKTGRRYSWKQASGIGRRVGVRSVRRQQARSARRRPRCRCRAHPRTAIGCSDKASPVPPTRTSAPSPMPAATEAETPPYLPASRPVPVGRRSGEHGPGEMAFLHHSDLDAVLVDGAGVVLGLAVSMREGAAHRLLAHQNLADADRRVTSEKADLRLGPGRASRRQSERKRQRDAGERRKAPDDRCICHSHGFLVSS